MNRNFVPTLLMSALALLAFAPAPASGADVGAIQVVGEGKILETVDTLITVAGETKKCECCGAGRCATCTTGSDGKCQCDYDWQGYPRCSA